MSRQYPTDSGNLVIDSITVGSGGATINGNATITGDLDVQGTTTLVATTTSGAVTIDLNSAEALLVRKDGDTGDILAVDTVNSRVISPLDVSHVFGGLSDATGFSIFSSDVGGGVYEFVLKRNDGNYRLAIQPNSVTVRFRSLHGSNISFGAGTASSATGADDVYIKNDFEVDGAAYFDHNVQLGGNSKIISFGSLASTAAGFYTRTDLAQQVIFAADGTGNQWVFGNTNSSFAQDFDHPLQTDPTWYFHSDTAPNTDNTQWMAISHDQTDAILDLGTGDFRFKFGDSGKGGVAADNGNAASTNIRVASTELTGLTGASATATNLIPDGAFVIGVSTRITTALGTTNGTTSYQVGDGTDVDRWGDSGAVTAGTTTDNTDATADPTGAFTAANNVVLTAVGGNFDGTGAVRIVVHYLDITAPTS